MCIYNGEIETQIAQIPNYEKVITEMSCPPNIFCKYNPHRSTVVSKYSIRLKQFK
jgi:hypothetical protein